MKARRVLVLAVSLCTLGAGAVTAGEQPQLPNGKGKDVVEAVCTGCGEIVRGCWSRLTPRLPPMSPEAILFT
jgi:hypothetical protein